MAGKFGGRVAAGVVALTVAAGACGYDSKSATGPGYGGGNDSTTGSGYSTMDGGSMTPASAISGIRVLRATGDLTQALIEFRARLGDPSNRTAGEQLTGRREINWDAVPAALTNVDTFPGDFFNRVVPRGQVYTTEGSGFRVSDNALGDLNPDYARQFAAFSPTRIFIPVRSRTMVVHFFVAGSNTPARVNGFGVVFSDVDVEGSASLSFLDAQGNLLQKVTAPARSDAAGFSFVGATFSSPVVAAVRIQSGRAPIAGTNEDISAGGESDLVAMDDFLSGEPHAIK